MRAVIFANGSLSHPEMDRLRIAPGDWILAADGGSRHCRALGLVPKVVIGDLDSLPDADRASLRSAGATFVLHPRSKDETDLELAVRYARQHGADEVLILGAMGERWDQTLANLTLLAAFDLPAGRLRLIDGSQEVCLVRGGETLPLDGRPGDTVSLIPIGGDADGVTTEGLEYPLRGETLRFGLTRGVSNVIQTSPVSVGVRRGSLLVTLIRMSWDEVM